MHVSKFYCSRQHCILPLTNDVEDVRYFTSTPTVLIDQMEKSIASKIRWYNSEANAMKCFLRHMNQVEITIWVESGDRQRCDQRSSHANLRLQSPPHEGCQVPIAYSHPDTSKQKGFCITCQVIYSQFGLAIHQNDHQARRRFVEWAQNEIAVVPDFHKRILFSDEAHFWLNGYVNKQNCRIWSEANPQVYAETPLHPEKLTVWCALWAGEILLQKR
ncbi:uncharacterized protein TNCV_858511 [Trichonephila clavipes]|nr:uncharacterized protein TNCV_858511 [Trichonephila clavipes]